MKNKEIKTDYSHLSHTHCWNNPSNPCGKKSHKQCCLCDKLFDEVEARKLSGEKPFKNWKEKIRKDYKEILSQEQIEETIKYWQDFIIQEKQLSFKEGYNEAKKLLDGIEKANKIILELKEEEFKKTLNNGRKMYELGTKQAYKELWNEYFNNGKNPEDIIEIINSKLQEKNGT